MFFSFKTNQTRFSMDTLFTVLVCYNLKVGKTTAAGTGDTEDYSFRLVISLELYIFTI